MKERPILFSAQMVRAILEGRKTQTRRVVKNPKHSPVDINNAEFAVNYDTYTSFKRTDTKTKKLSNKVAIDNLRCPHGTVGDQLWVRETWMPLDADHVIGGQRFAYRAETTEAGEECRKDYVRSGRDYRWRPSIHMPRSASRLTLEITGVRVERLQEISDADCRAEGCCHRGWDATDWRHPHNENGWNIERANFASLWSSINGPQSWTANPWVWVIEFRRVQP